MFDLTEIVSDDWLDQAEIFIRSKILQLVPTKTTTVRPSQWAPAKRYLPPGTTDMPGPFSWSATPYFQGLIDCFAEDSPIESLAILKGAQIGYNVGMVENLLGWIIDESPGPSIFTSGDREMAEQNMELRIDKMIQSAGIGSKIFSQTATKGSKRTGNTKGKKEFLGGFLLGIGPNSGSKLRNVSIRYGLFDEIDASFGEIKGEGDYLDIIERRFDAFEDTRKKLYGSTPTELSSSRIHKLYLLGDQRKYFVPCKSCGEPQELLFFPDDNGKGGIRWKTHEDGSLIQDSVHYSCAHCASKWHNSDKTFFLSPKNGAHWRPSTKTKKIGHASAYLPSWYAGIGLRTWESIVEEYLLTKGDISKLKVFTTTVQGVPWENRRQAIPYEKVMVRKGGYSSGILPEGVNPLIITLGADVQADRIECEVVAYLENFVSYSVEYCVFFGDTSKIEEPAWQQFADHIESSYNGRAIDLAFVDSGYNTPIVYEFCASMNGVYPVMGDSNSARKGKGPVFIERPIASHGVTRIDLFTDIIKQEFYGYIQKSKGDNGEIPRGYCHFPSDYPAKIFEGYLAETYKEKMLPNGQRVWRWEKIHQRNEPLDCRVYSMGAVYFLASAWAQNRGEELIDWKEFWADWGNT